MRHYLRGSQKAARVSYTPISLYPLIDNMQQMAYDPTLVKIQQIKGSDSTAMQQISITKHNATYYDNNSMQQTATSTVNNKTTSLPKFTSLPQRTLKQLVEETTKPSVT